MYENTYFTAFEILIWLSKSAQIFDANYREI